MRNKIIAVVLAVLMVLAIIWVINHFSENRGAANEQLKQGQEQTKTGEKLLARVDTVYKTDTIRLTRSLQSYKTLHDTLRITDTTQVKVFVATADSTIHACLLTVQTCEQKDSAHKIIEAGLRRQNDALQKLVPGKIERFVTALKWVAVGGVIGYAAHR